MTKVKVRQQDNRRRYGSEPDFPKVTHVHIGTACPICGASLVQRVGKNGAFIGCKAYPVCTYTDSLKQTNTVRKLSDINSTDKLFISFSAACAALGWSSVDPQWRMAMASLATMIHNEFQTEVKPVMRVGHGSVNMHEERVWSIILGRLGPNVPSTERLYKILRWDVPKSHK